MASRPRLIIRGLSILSALGASNRTSAEIWKRGFELTQAPYRTIDETARSTPVFPLNNEAEALVEDVARDERYHRLDRTAQLGVAAARRTLVCLNHFEDPASIGCISIGSSRGATLSLEESFQQFDRDGRVAPLTSPVTTSGNISSWVAQEYIATSSLKKDRAQIVALSTSMTCSSALHALLVAKSFVCSGMSSAALFGGAEACLTPYTIAQLQALRIYGALGDTAAPIPIAWPCRPLDFARGDNSVVLGEGAGTALLIKVENDSDFMPGDLEILGIGWALESVPSPTGISHDGAAFEMAMRMAIDAAEFDFKADKSVIRQKIGAVVLHAPGSRLGDEAEIRAVRRLFGDVPICSTKHLTGHTYGASGMLSLGLAEGLLSGLKWGGFPYMERDLMPSQPAGHSLSPGSAVLINSAGFGGNAISLLVGSRKMP
jgi:3-oxoacyl-[acyl-carrier-protein] synthase II